MAKVLLVDDEENIRQYYVDELSKEGHQVSAVANGYQLFALIELSQPDVIILDIKLVGYNGLELLQEIRNRHIHLPIVLCSAYDIYKQDERSSTADYYLIKSFDLSELKMTIKMATNMDANDYMSVG